MRPYHLRDDLKRAAIGGFTLPLGLVPGDVDAPTEGYTVEYSPGEEDEPDTYSFHIVVSHERLAAVVHRMFDLLPAEVFGIVEIGSRDAYRSLDVYMAQEPTDIDEFLRGWDFYERFLLEDAAIGAGANAEDPFIEVFLDQWKGISVLAPLLMREKVEAICAEFGLAEVARTWPMLDDEAAGQSLLQRSVLQFEDEYSPDVDEILLQLRHVWGLELNVDPDANTDDSGRELGDTLWHAMAIVESVKAPQRGAYVSVWATAGSLSQMEDLVDAAMEPYPLWRFIEIFTIDRVAYDDRPENLAELPPRRQQAEVHLVLFELWPDPAEKYGAGDSTGDYGRV